MRRFIFYFLFVLSFIIPANVNAVSINGVKISGDNEAMKGDYVVLKFAVSQNGLKAGTSQTLGIQYAAFGLDYDADDLQLVNLSSNNFDLNLIYEDNELYVLGTTKEGIGSNMCSWNLLYCGDLEVEAKFYVLETTKKSYDIRIYNPEFLLLNIVDDRDYYFDDLQVVESDKSYTHTINIVDGTNKKNEKPKKILTASKENLLANKKLEKNVTSNPNKAKVKSDNNYLKSLNIKNHEIDFNKDKDIYRINVSDKVNTIEVTVEPEDLKAKYEIIGNNNFKDNDNKIEINVTSENGELRTYTIYINVKETKEDIVEEDNTKDKISNKLFGYAKIGGIGLGILIVIIFIINKWKDRKINKFLDKI